MPKTPWILALTATAVVACDTPDIAPDSPPDAPRFDHVALLLHLEPQDTAGDAASDAGPRGLETTLHGDLSWRDSPSGQGLDLGDTGWIAVPGLGAPDLDAMDWTIVLALRLSAAATDGNRAILQTRSSDGDLGQTLLYVSPDCGGTLASLVGPTPVCGRTALVPEQWVQVAVSYDRTTDHLRLFVDGVLDGEGHVAASPLGEGLLVGINRSLETQHLGGAVDELLIVAEALDEDGLAERLDQGTPWPEPVCTELPADTWLWLEASDADVPWADVGEGDDADLAITCSVVSATCEEGFATVPPALLPPLADSDFTISVRARLDADDPSAADLTLVQVADGRTLLYADASCGGAAASFLGGAELCGPPLIPGRWSQLSLSRSAADQMTRLYVDGLLVAASPRPMEGGAEGLLLGVGRSQQHQWWDGAMDDLLVWDRVLTPAEVASLSAAGDDLCLP